MSRRGDQPSRPVDLSAQALVATYVMSCFLAICEGRQSPDPKQHTPVLREPFVPLGPLKRPRPI